MSDEHLRENQLQLQETQVLLAEERTYYSLFRLGLGLVTLPLTIIAFLIATAKYHHVFDEAHVALTLLVSLAVLAFGGLAICVRTQRKIARISHLLQRMKRENRRIAELLV